MSEHIASPKFYVFIWILLLVCTALTVGAALLDLGPFNTVVALAIASFKAVVVVLFFMHVKYASERMTKIVIVSGIFWLVLMLVLTLADYGAGRPIPTA